MFRTSYLRIIWSFHAGLMTASKHSQDPDSAWKRSSNLHETYQRRMYSRKLLMMRREDARNVWSFMAE
jgi:hypothetical protein